MRHTIFLAILTACSCSQPQTASVSSDVPLDSVTAIARDAYVYGYPMVENYRVLYKSSQDSSYNKYAAFNSFYHEKNVASPADTLFVAPNGDTPYSYAVLDLRKGPVILTIPPMDSSRYFGFPLYDLYTHIIFTFSKRTVGSKGGRFLIASYQWKGQTPPGIDTTVFSETDLVYLLARTQLFGPNDLKEVHNLQSKYSIQPLIDLTNKEITPDEKLTHPPMAPQTPRTQPSLAFFGLMNDLLQFCHPHPSETELLKRFASIGIKPGNSFQVTDTAVQNAVLKGIAEAQQMFLKKLPTVKFAAELFGTREQLNNDYLARAVGAWVGIYANQVEEYVGLQGFESEPDGKPFNGKNKYTVTFPSGGLPPVDGFWSITLYHSPSRFMYANQINRNLINSVMVPQLKKNTDGSITLYIQHDPPPKDLERNWLPCPKSDFTMVFRTYLPKESIRTGIYKTPQVLKTNQKL